MPEQDPTQHGTTDLRPDAQVRIPLAMLNRHGLAAGATRTGADKAGLPLLEPADLRSAGTVLGREFTRGLLGTARRSR